MTNPLYITVKPKKKAVQLIKKSFPVKQENSELFFQFKTENKYQDRDQFGRS